jgi:hypothetical protein
MSQTKAQLFDTSVDGPASLKTGAHNATLDASGNLNIGTGNLIVPSGKGIDFSATSGSGTSELLDDYEEGTWTPFFCKTNTEENMFVSNNLTIYQADYRRVGDKVMAGCYIANDAAFSYDTGRSSTDALSIGGLPFQVKGSTYFYAGSVGFFANWTGWSAGYTPMCYALSGGSSIALKYAIVNSTSDVQATHMLNPSSAVMVSVAYIAA